MKVITDDELEAWIQAGDGQIVDDYTVPLYDEAALKAGIEKERARCARIAHNGCLVYPDGGSPTEEEAALCEEIARRIRGA